jgi:hypothetical protein
MNIFYTNIVILRRKTLIFVHNDLITEVCNSEESVGIKSACYIMSRSIPVIYQYKHNQVIGYEYMYVCMYVCMYVFIGMYLCMYVCMYVRMYLRTACIHTSCI